MNSLKQLFGGNIRQFGMVFALIALIVFFQISTSLQGNGNFWVDGNVLSPQNLQGVVNNYAYVLVLAIGMVMVIIMGHIDLSVGSVAAFVGIVVATASAQWHLAWYWCILIGLAMGALAGAWQGFWVAYVGVPAFITTLAGMMIFRGLNQVIGQQNTITITDPTYNFIGNGFIPDNFVDPNGQGALFNWPTVCLGLLAVLYLVLSTYLKRARAQRAGTTTVPAWVDAVRTTIIGLVVIYLTYLFATGRPNTSFPVAGIILVVLVVFYQFLTSRTVAGRAIYAVGGNRQAARLSGINDKKVDFFVMMNMSVLASVAGMMFVARSQGSGPLDGTGWELDAIASVFIGGAAVSGGVGTVVGSIIGGLVMAFLNNGLQLMSAPQSTTYVVKGLVLLIAVAFDVWSKRQGKPSLIGALQKGLSGNRPKPSAEQAAAGITVAPITKDTPGSLTPRSAAEADSLVAESPVITSADTASAAEAAGPDSTDH